MLTHSRKNGSFIKYLMTYIVALTATASFANNINLNSHSNSNAGQLSPLGTFTVFGGSDPADMSMTSDGKFAYVVNYETNEISQFSVRSDGQLIQLNPFTVSTGNYPKRLAITQDNKFAYSINMLANSISEYSVGTDGQLRPLTPSTIPIPDNCSSYDFIVITPDNRFAYITAETNSGSYVAIQFIIGANGQLVPNLPATLIPTQNLPKIAMTSDGKYVYAYDAETIAQYSVGPIGQLISLPQATVSTGCTHFPLRGTITPDARFAYFSCIDPPYGNVLQFSIDANGQLKPLAAPMGGVDDPAYSIVTPNGKFIYVANESGDNISQFSIGENGQLSMLNPPTVGAGRAPYGWAITPDNQFAYVTDRQNRNIYQYRIKVS